MKSRYIETQANYLNGSVCIIMIQLEIMKSSNRRFIVKIETGYGFALCSLMDWCEFSRQICERGADWVQA